MAAIICLQLLYLTDSKQGRNSTLHTDNFPFLFFVMTCQGHIKQAAITEKQAGDQDLNEDKSTFDGHYQDVNTA